MCEQKNNKIVYLDDESRSKLKKKQIEIFEVFLRICDKHQLVYFVVGGTALGTVRHKGYIPWDDDIDVALPREDYEHFLEIAQSELNEKYFLQTHKTDPEYRFDYAKIRDRRTTFKEYSVSKLNINHGIYIDVFPIDGYPESKLKAWALEKRKTFTKCYLAKDNIYLFDREKSIKEKIILSVAKIIFWGKSTTEIIEGLQKQYKTFSYRESPMVVCHGGAWGNKEICEKEQYGQGGFGVFENIEVKLPEKIHEYLSHKYGDYMKLPPTDKQVPHHYCSEIDFGESHNS